MWIIKNEITKAFFAGWHGEKILTADNKKFASHYPTWEAAMREVEVLTNNWKPLLKDEA